MGKKRFIANGNGAPDVPTDPAKISQAEHVTLVTLRSELESMRRRKRALERELAFLAADVFRKEDELNAKGAELSKKYGIALGKRALDFATGKIIDYPEPAK